MGSCFVVILGVSGCSRQAPPKVTADLLVRHANIHTMDEKVQRGTALAVQGDRILWVGDESAAAGFIGEKRRVGTPDGGWVPEQTVDIGTTSSRSRQTR
jgi:hypothetical protein